MSCCVCGLSLSTGKGKNRHKKLNGKRFSAGKATLIWCIELYGTTLAAIGLDKPTCVVCYQCVLKLEKISKLQSNVERIRMDILHNLFGIDDNSLSSNDDCQQNSTDTVQHVQGTEQLEHLENIQQNLAGSPRSVQATEQLEPLENVQQNLAGTPQSVQATEQLEPLENIQQNLAGTPQSVQATEQLEPLENVQQNLAGTPRSVQVTDQPAAEYYEPRRKRSKVTVSITSLLYICAFIFAYS